MTRLPNVDPAALTGDPVNTWCPYSYVPLTGRRRLDNFMRDKSTDVVSGQHLADTLNIVPTKGRRATELGLLFG
jgi:hypothetical protein